jgi:hypothetical protein
MDINYFPYYAEDVASACVDGIDTSTGYVDIFHFWVHEGNRVKNEVVGCFYGVRRRAAAMKAGAGS